MSEVKVFVLDEADNMLDQDGLGDQTLRVKKFVRPSRNVMFILIFPAVSYPVAKLFKLSSFLPRSLIMSELSPQNSHPTPTRSSLKKRN